VPLPSRKQMAMPEENIPKMIARMKEIRDMDVKVLFDGHHGPISNPREHIEKRIDFLSQLQKRVLCMAKEGKTIPEIKTALGFPEPWYLPNTEGRFEVEHLIRSLLEDAV
jgi:ribonuclease/clavin/mitogillin